MKKKAGIILTTFLCLLLLLMFDREYEEDQQVFINEVRCWDASASRNGYFGSDYIELYNASDSEVSLEGWFLSDDATDRKKNRLEGVSIEPGGFVLLYANSKNDTGFSLNFKLNPEGEKIFLSDAAGMAVDSVCVPKQKFGTVYARKEDGAREWCVKEESAAYSNHEAKVLPVCTLNPPEFSHESGFYEKEFKLMLKASKGETIYYTLDGSEPTEESLRYREAITITDTSGNPNVCNAAKNVVQDWKAYKPDNTPVDKARVVRAVAADQNGNVSDVVTNTYFVGLDQYKDRKVVSIAADFEDMFGAEGIFSTGDGYDSWYLTGGETEWVAPNFLQSGRRWEIQGNMEAFEGGKNTMDQKVGIRTQGASTRLDAKKKMSIFSREEYSGSPYFEGISFGDQKTHSIYTNHSISNIVFPELLKDRRVAIQHPAECTVFLNGEYWYDTYLLEKYNKYYLEEAYGVRPDNVILIKDRSASEGPENAYDSYIALLDMAAATDLSIEENYKKFSEIADIQSYIDYLCANIYLCNMDMSETKNMVLWRTIDQEPNEFGDTKWRWMIYDIDCVEWIDFGFYGAAEKAAVNSFQEVMQFTEMAIKEHKIYASGKSNENFCKQFVLTFMDMANVNFAPENVEKAFEMWDAEFNSDLSQFFTNRFSYIVPYMAEEFALTGTLEEVNLKVNDEKGGRIILNTTTPDLSKGSWTGQYYTDYPITVTAEPEKGYKFIGWSGSVTSDHATIEAEVVPGGITLEAVFEKMAE